MKNKKMKPHNMDFSKRVVVNTYQEDLIESFSEGVNMINLEMEGDESGHLTAILEIRAGLSFNFPSHPLGEELFVLEGELSDEKGNYKAGTYIRNPPGSSFHPFSKKGCHIFVKYNQMNPKDRKRVVLNTNNMTWYSGHGNLKALSLFNFMEESASLVTWPKGEKFIHHHHYGGEEILVLKGIFKDEHGVYPKGTWIRSPHMSSHFPYVEEETIIFVKNGHLKFTKI